MQATMYQEAASGAGDKTLRRVQGALVGLVADLVAHLLSCPHLPLHPLRPPTW